jgi:hypothetical protein
LIVVLGNPAVQIALQPSERAKERTSKGDPIKLVQHGLQKPFTNAVGLRPFDPRARVRDVITAK